MVGEWSLAVDDCIGVIRGAGASVQFKDFGQCKNLKERVGAPSRPPPSLSFFLSIYPISTPSSIPLSSILLSFPLSAESSSPFYHTHNTLFLSSA